MPGGEHRPRRVFLCLTTLLSVAYRYAMARQIALRRITGRDFQTIRKALGLTQAQMAGKFGVTRQTVSHWEQGRRKPRADVLLTIMELGKASLPKRLR